jgi:hypothetical protein
MRPAPRATSTRGVAPQSAEPDPAGLPAHDAAGRAPSLV